MIQEHVDIKPYTYFKIGGQARYFAEVKNLQELREAIEFAKKHAVPFVVLGAASNVLVADKGYEGLIIRLMMRGIEQDGDSLRVEAGVPNAVAVARSVKEGLAGLEWAIGIPGTIGGSVRGNAGCFSGEMKDVVESVQFLNTETGEIEEKDNAFCQFGYRDSIFKKNPQWIILNATLKLRRGDPEASQKLLRYYSSTRSDSQDIGASSAGCVFKNIPWPENPAVKKRLLHLFPQLADFASQTHIPAGFVIDHIIGLKGKTIGRVSISKKHANYLINHGGASAEEVVMMISLLKEHIHRKCNLFPEEEIQYIGF